MTTNTTSSPAPAEENGNGGRRSVLIAVLAVGAVAAAGWWWHARSYESTEDAFLEADVTMIAPRIAGTVISVQVQDNQQVKAGDVLFELDAADLQARVRQAEANLAAAQAQARSAQADLTMTNTSAPANVAQAQAAVRAARAQAERAQADAKRYESLYAKDEISAQSLDQARSSARALQAQAEQAAAQLTMTQTAPQQTAAKEAMLASAQAAIAQAQAALDLARLQLSYAHVIAPSAGRVTHKNLQPGTQLAAGSPVLALVGAQTWVVANFKETQLQHMRVGQPVNVEIDAYPGQAFSARVHSLQAGTGSAFALLPPENATGNFIKVVQRVPVKLVFDPAPDAALHLVPGMSVLPRVDISDDAQGAQLQAATQ
ncbi:HlyD family secretion protein [Solimonas sp. K1W22B-7]|uniref:HlyD family secretion protein n=1 Tax=Solimonas sp. K1W22B-7 TaxID=2303331 RepID=UPI000E3345C9|nr:HlyD family secretion protein [Solimonas sp. K1W22B-7]AXQ29971.1 HlyD family secretion protein [Solimonas sp. K1W22B-7]